MKRTALALTAILALLIPSIANAQITSSYSNNTNINPVAFTLTIYSPDNQTYKNTMPLNFTIDWTTYPTFAGLPSPPAPIMNGVYSYTIDNNTAVTVTSNQSSTDHFDPRGFKVNPSFSYLLNVSNLANGYHKIVITADLYDNYGDHLYFDASSAPVFFSVQNPTPTPTPFPALASPLTVTVIVTIAVLAAVIASLLLYRRHRKTTNLKH